MGAETESSRKTFFRKPDCAVWSTTAAVAIILIWCVLVITLTATGQLCDEQNFECGDSVEFASWPKRQLTLVLSWGASTVLACILVLLESWRRNGRFFKTIAGTTCVLTVVMVVSGIYIRRTEIQEIQQFKERYLSLRHHIRIPEKNQLREPVCSTLTNVDSWQTQFMCCGLESHRDWKSSIPDSCLCDGRETNDSACVKFEDRLVYEKPCLPIVIQRLETHNSLFWIIMMVWVSIVSAPWTVCCLCVAGLIIWAFFYCLHFLGEDQILFLNSCFTKKKIPVVFIKIENNNQVLNKDAVIDSPLRDGSDTAEKECNAEDQQTEVNPVKMISRFQLRTLQEGLDPPPVLHRVENGHCLCILPPSKKTKDFYTVRMEEGSPLLPKDAVLVDANIPMEKCLWDEGHRYYDVKDIVWPKKPEPENLMP